MPLFIEKINKCLIVFVSIVIFFLSWIILFFLNIKLAVTDITSYCSCVGNPKKTIELGQTEYNVVLIR